MNVTTASAGLQVLSAHRRLIDEVADLYRRAEGVGEPHATMLRAAALHLAQFDLRSLRPGRGARKPACRHIPAALARAQSGPLRNLAEAFAAVEPGSDWSQNPNYRVDRMGPEFLENYGYVELVGPGRPVDSRTFLVGFLVLGPEMLYPDHSHRAAEVYHVVAGNAEWWRERDDWTARAPGAVIAHAPAVRHAMRTRGEPLLALYCWQGEIAEFARLNTHEP